MARNIGIRSHQANVYKRTNAEGTCLWCGRRLRKGVGDYRDEAFCGLRCGYMFGVAAATNQFRLKPVEQVALPPKLVYKRPRCPECKAVMHADDSYLAEAGKGQRTFSCVEDCDRYREPAVYDTHETPSSDGKRITVTYTPAS